MNNLILQYSLKNQGQKNKEEAVVLQKEDLNKKQMIWSKLLKTQLYQSNNAFYSTWIRSGWSMD